MFESIRKDKNILFIDVGSASIGIASIPEHLVADGDQRTVCLERAYLKIDEAKPKAVDLLPRLTQLLNTIIEKNTKSIGAIKGVVVTFSAPWYQATAGTVHKDFEKEKKIEEGTLSDLLKEARANLLPPDGDLVDDSVLAVSINNYPTEQPVGKKGGAITLSLLRGSLLPKVKDAFSEVIQKYYGDTPQIFHVLALPYLHVMRSTFGTEEAVLVDVTGEMTDILIMRDGILWKRVAIPMGSRTLIRSLITEKEREGVATNTLSLLLEGTLESQGNKDLQRKIAQFQKEWVSSVAKELLEMAKEAPLPTRLFLLSENRTKEWFTQNFSRLDFAPATITNEPFQVESVDKNNLAPEEPFACSDPFLLLSSLYYRERVKYARAL